MKKTILPSILSSNFASFTEDVVPLLAELVAHRVGGDIIHVDIMDGHFVPNISFGPPVVAKLRKAMPGVFFDTHLMIDEPIRYAQMFRDAGSDCLTIHVEAPQVKGDLVGAVKAIRETGADVGITLNPDTKLEAILPALPHVDLVLVMSVFPGFGGQKFMPDQLSKVRELRKLLRGDQVLEIDGGINTETIGDAAEAGVDWFVIGSALFDAPSRPDTVEAMARHLRPA